MGTRLMGKVERVGVQTATGRLQVGSLAPSPPLTWRLSALGSGLWFLGSGKQVLRRPKGGVVALDSALQTKNALDPPVLRQAGQGASHSCSRDWYCPAVQTAPSSQEARVKCRAGLRQGKATKEALELCKVGIP